MRRLNRGAVGSGLAAVLVLLPIQSVAQGDTAVLIPVAVTVAGSGKPFAGLEKKDFRIFENKVEQEIASFSREDAPISVGIVFDSSGSMNDKLKYSGQAVAQFMGVSNPADEFFLIQANERPNVTVPFTKDISQIQSGLASMIFKGRAALLDAVYDALNEMKKARNPRKAVLIVSARGDDSSRYTESEVKNLLREVDVQIYALGIFDGSRGRTPEERGGPELLSDLANPTGGRHFPVENLSALPEASGKIGLQLRNEYVLGYHPKNSARDGKYRKVEVQVVKKDKWPPLKIINRLGYYAPSQ